MYVVSIIGVGQLGSRHLQAIARIALPLTIYVVDVSEQSLKIARERFEEIEGYQNKNIFYVRKIADLPVELDVAVVASNSLNRWSIIKQLLSEKAVRYLILEKFLFPKLDEYDHAAQLLKDKGVKAWVNCPRRAMDFYKGLIESIKGNVHFSVTGANWGLGCNSIHFLDLFSKMTASDVSCCLGNNLDKILLNSRRHGYVEFTGSLYLGNEKGDTLELVSYNSGVHPLMIRISTPDSEWIISETKKEYIHFAGGNDWQPEKGTFHIPLQSEVGSTIIMDLLQSGRCELTPYEDSQRYHQFLLNIFIDQYSHITKIENADLCPIT